MGWVISKGDRTQTPGGLAKAATGHGHSSRVTRIQDLMNSGLAWGRGGSPSLLTSAHSLAGDCTALLVQIVISLCRRPMSQMRDLVSFRCDCASGRFLRLCDPQDWIERDLHILFGYSPDLLGLSARPSIVTVGKPVDSVVGLMGVQRPPCCALVRKRPDSEMQNQHLSSQTNRMTTGGDV